VKVLIYTRNNCVWCDRAKNLLKINNLEYEEIDLSDDVLRENFYKKFNNSIKTMPQIFIDNNRIGGFEALVDYLDGK
jgi:glutaredoxin 3